jgi:plastocyanin
MRAIYKLLLLSSLALGSAAPAQEWRYAPEYDVLLTSYDIAPAEIRLKAGEAVRLRFVNNSNRSHDFSAASFFSSATLRRRDSETVKGGKVKVGPLQTVTIALVPKAGRYKARSDNFFRRLFGMSGTIVVE